jgi:hypothetical protein
MNDILRELEAQRAELRKLGRRTQGRQAQPGSVAVLQLQQDMREADVLMANSRQTLALRERVRPKHKQARLLMAQSASRAAAQALELLGEPVDQPETVFEREAFRR